MSHLASNDPTTVYPSQGEGTEGQPNSSNHEYKQSYPPAEAEYDEIAQNPHLFHEKLKGFHESFGTRLKVPTIGGRALDLHRLFLEVTFRGGIEKVIRDRKWKEVIAAMNFPSTITSASFVVRKYYLSLLYHFEQVYFFRKDIPSIPLDDPASRNPENGSAASHLFKEGASMNQLAVNFIVETGSSVTGTIDAKFDNGYLISVNLGSERLKGVLYHTALPPDASQNSDDISAEPPHRNPKSYQLTFKDPSRPKSNRSGYNFFFAENYNRLKPSYHGQEKEITKKIGELWNRLTDAEKQVYQDQGTRDKERYRSEMLEYRSSNNENAR